MDKVLNFDENYNGKLWTLCFTTIRTRSTIKEKNLNLGDIVRVSLNRNVLFSAQIINFEYINLDELSLSQKTLLSLDTGLYWKQAIYKLRNKMKSNYLAVLTLSRCLNNIV